MTNEGREIIMYNFYYIFRKGNKTRLDNHIDFKAINEKAKRKDILKAKQSSLRSR